MACKLPNLTICISISLIVNLSPFKLLLILKSQKQEHIAQTKPIAKVIYKIWYNMGYKEE